MSDFKFPCPSCGQHISCETSDTGREVQCPACKATLTVPQPGEPAQTPAAAPQGLSIAASMAKSHAAAEARAHSAPASTTQWKPTANGTAPMRPTAQRTSVLAIVSLVCSLTTIGIVPAIICGHLAKARMAKDPSLKGMKLANAGLAISYLTVVLALGIIVFGVDKFKDVVKQAYQQTQPQPTNAVVAASEAVSTNAPEAEQAPATPAVWTLDLASTKIPNRKAAGKLHGVDFTVESTKVENGILSIRQGNDLVADAQCMLYLGLKPGESIEGKTYQVAANQTEKAPFVHLSYKSPGQNVAKTEIFAKGYALKLEFGNAKKGKIKARIYLCLPDKMKSFVAGTFVTDLVTSDATTKKIAELPGKL